MRKNTDQKNSEYGHFSRSKKFGKNMTNQKPGKSAREDGMNSVVEVGRGINKEKDYFTDRNSRPDVFCEKGVLKFRKIHRKLPVLESLF